MFEYLQRKIQIIKHTICKNSIGVYLQIIFIAVKHNIWEIFNKIFKCRLSPSPPINWNIWEDIYMIN